MEANANKPILSTHNRRDACAQLRIMMLCCSLPHYAHNTITLVAVCNLQAATVRLMLRELHEAQMQISAFSMTTNSYRQGSRLLLVC